MINPNSLTKPPHPDPLKRGDRLGEIMLLERIGRGGEGQIWSGIDGRRRRVVAIKVVRILDQTDANLAKVSHDFERQVHLIASLDHPNILPLYEFGSSGPHFYFVMRYTPLGSLADLLKEGPLTLQETIHYTAQIARSLDYLHSQGIVHRDLKTSNILLGSNRQIYLTDFGLAKRLSKETMALHTGRGTGPYAPYEQHTFAQLTPQTDIYSMGIVFYEMLTGRLPWDGETNLATQQFSESAELPDVREIHTGLPPAITQALRRLTAFDWQERPGSAREAFQLLQSAAVTINHQPLIDPYSPPTSNHEDLVEADNAQTLWQTLQAQGSDPLHVSLTHLAFLNSAYSKEKIDRLVRDDSLRQFMLAGAIVHDYHINYWWLQVTEPQARLGICEKILLQNNSAIANRTLSLLTNLQRTVAVTFSENLLDYLIDLVTTGTSTAVRGRALDILTNVANERQSWQPVGFTPEGDAKLADLALSDSSAAGRVTQLIGQVHSQTALQILLHRQKEVESARFTNMLQEIQAAAGSLPPLVSSKIRLRLWLNNLKVHFLEDKIGVTLTRGLLGLYTGILLSLLMLLGLFSQVDDQMRDGLLTPYPTSNIVTIVAVDDRSLSHYGRWDQWPRSLHGELIEQLQAAGAKAIVFDFNFDSNTADDAPLLAAMQASGNIIQPISGQGDALHENPGTLNFQAGIFPEEDFLAAGTAVGHTNLLHDDDGYVRQIPTTINIGDQSYPSIAIRALEHFLGIHNTTTPKPENGFLSTVGRQIPVDTYGEMRIYYAGPPAQPGSPGNSVASTFQTVSYLDVLQEATDQSLFRDKIVLVGITATTEPDSFLTPVSRQGRPMYGVEILANTIEAIWSNKFIIRPNDLTRIAILLSLGILTGFLCARPWSGLVLAGALGTLYFLLTSLLFDTRAIMLDILLPFLTIAGSYVTVTTYRYAVETRRRREMVDLFADHLSPEITERALTAVRQGRLKLEGQEQTISVLVINLQTKQEYTLLHEPEQIITLFKEYLNLIKETLFGQKGTIVTISNQQIVAMFNSPLPQKDHEQQAVDSAIKIQNRLHSFSPSLPLNQAGSFVIGRYAIDTGRAVVGYTGASHRDSYRIIGTPLETAAHLTTLARSEQILITQATYNNLDSDTQNKTSPAFSGAGDVQIETIFEISA